MAVCRDITGSFFAANYLSTAKNLFPKDLLWYFDRVRYNRFPLDTVSELSEARSIKTYHSPRRNRLIPTIYFTEANIHRIFLKMLLWRDLIEIYKRCLGFRKFVSSLSSSRCDFCDATHMTAPAGQNYLYVSNYM